jgi:anaerobic ribonucleoside-triphosphate reductase
MQEGRKYGQLMSLPPKRADSFIAQVSEVCMDLSQEFAGAIAPSDIVINLAWYAKNDNLSDEKIINLFQSYVHVMNNKFRISSESPFTNLSLFDKPILEHLTENMCYPDASKPDVEYIMHIQKIFGEWFARGDPITGLPYRFPVITVNLSKSKEGKICDEDFLDWISKNNLNTGCFNIYINEGMKIASCCRLVSDVERMRQFRGDSFGNGGLNLGSHRVITVNLPRIAIKSAGDCDKFRELLYTNLDICRDLLQVHREEILVRRINLGFLKFYNPLKWFTLDSMFSTVGIIGIYEMTELMGKNIRTEEGSNFVANILDAIENYVKETSTKTGHAFNCEEIPGEGTAIKLCNMDKIVFGNDKVPYEMYSNQYIPLIVDASIPERITLSGKFQDRISGGGILHLNIKEQITDPAVMKHLIEQCVKNSVSHFSINYGFGTCENGHTTVCGNATKCPKCNAEIVSHMSRVIGYFSIVNNWSKVRREYEFPKRVFS